MTERHRTGTALLLLALCGLLPGIAMAEGPWGEHFFQDEGERSPLDTIPDSGLPPAWVLPQPGGYLPGSPTFRSTSISLNPLAGTIRESHRQGDVEVGEPLVSGLDAYNQLLTRRTKQKLWQQLTRNSRSVARTSAARGGLFRVDLPVQLPKPIRAIVGDGAPNLEVSGSETITLGGQSDWTVRHQGFGIEGRRPSAFPSLEMKQDLQVNLTGSIGDKIKVDVDQSSNVQTTLDNKVKLRYDGDENDLVQSVELGNTNLSLAGASFRQDGLFGVKTVMKMGTVDLTTIASRQEGKSETARFSPSGEARSVQVSDLSYIQRRYYFVADHPISWDHGTLNVFKDDRVPATNEPRGLLRLDPTSPADTINQTNPQERGYFTRLVPNTDYDIITPYLTNVPDREIPVIRLRVPLGPNEMLGVTYVDKTSGAPIQVGRPDSLADDALGKDQGQFLLKMIKPDIESYERDEVGRFIPTTVVGGVVTKGRWYQTLGYELRNFYDLNARNIDLSTLNLVVRRRDNSLAVDPEQIGGVPLIQLLGLDQRDANGGFTPDGRIDPNFIDLNEGTLFLPDLHPFDPDTTAICSPVDSTSGFLCLDNLKRNPLRERLGDYQANPQVYYFRTPNPATDSRFYIDASFKSSQQGYSLGRFNILEGSEQVKVNNVLYTRGTQYSIDYDTGQITFATPPGPQDVITVDYSFAPGVGQVQRTLLGFSSSYVPSQNFTLSSSMIYESRGASEQNPKLGEEPARSVIADLSSVGTVHPQFMTDVSNLIPGVRTNQQSTLNVQGGISMSLPNPNTQGEAYLDDMEGNKETTTIPLGRPLWMWSSIPYADSLGTTRASAAPADHGTIWWYNARGVKEHDLKPDLPNEQGGDAERTVLEINVKPNSVGGSTAFTPDTWTGITQPVSRLGDDYSKLRYVEIWVNDRALNGDHSLTSGVLHLDFGTVDEDAFWNQREGPNGVLDTEDKNLDTKLDVTDKTNEDTGLDGLSDKDEPGYDPQTNPDPNGDDYHYDDGSTDYSHINGTEGNGKSSVNPRPDTEDLNENNILDRGNDYFETSIDLKDAAYVAVDVAKDYAGKANVKENNGWRLFRIPIASDAFHRVGNPNWDNIKHLRLWLSGLQGNASGNFNIQIGSIELVGNRWLRQPIDSSMVERGVDLDVRSVNNKDDPGYSPPFAVKNAPGGSATQREQSLALAYTKLETGDSVFAFRTVGDAGGPGYTQYREIRFWVHGDGGALAQNLRLVARFGADTVSYYEYSLPVAPGWQSVSIPMEVLSRLKDSPGNARVKVDSTTSAAQHIYYTSVGNPSFTRISRVTFGLTMFGGTPGEPGDGEVWVDELRLAGVRKDTGTSGNVVVQANFADVLALNGTFQGQDADFFRVGSGVNQGTGFNHKSYGLSTTFNADRMLPQSGLQVPIRYVFQQTTDVPKFRIGSDVVLGADRADIETSRSNSQSIDLSYRRTGPRRGWTRFTADALSGNLTYARTGSVTPQSADSSWRFTSGLNYDLPIGGGPALPLAKRIRFKFLPENIGLGMNWLSSRTTRYTRNIDSLDTRSLQADTKIRQLDLSGSTSYVPLSSITLGGQITSRRNMLLHDEGPFGWNKGTETAHTQRLSLSWQPRWLVFLTPTVAMTGTYAENGGPDRRVNEGDPLNIKDISNTGNARVTATIPISRVGARSGRPSAARDSTRSFLRTSARYFFSRLQDITTTFNFDRSTAISRVTGSPGFAFKTGFTQLFDPGLTRLTNSNVQNNRRYGTGAHTGFKPSQSVSIDLQADQSLSYTDAIFGARRTFSLSWPDVTLRWQELQRLLGLTNEASSLALNSHYSFKVDESGPTGAHPDKRLETTTWAPILGWQGSWKNGFRTDVKTAYTTTKDIDETLFGVTRTRSTVNHDVQVSKIFPASKGIKFPWSKRRVRLPNDVNLNLTVSIQDLKQETLNPYGFNVVEQDQQTLSISSGTSYNFSTSVTGGFNMGFGQTKDNKSDIITRHVNVAFNAQFRF